MFLEDLDIGYQAGMGIASLDEVVAEDAVIGEAPMQDALEWGDLVDALADEGAGAEEVLVDIGDRPAVGIDARLTRVDSGEC